MLTILPPNQNILGFPGNCLTIRTISSGLSLSRCRVQNLPPVNGTILQFTYDENLSVKAIHLRIAPTKITDQVVTISLRILSIDNKKRKQIPYCPVLFQNQAEEILISVTLPSYRKAPCSGALGQNAGGRTAAAS